MPDFVAALAAAAVFCLSLIVLNALTRLALLWQVAPHDLAENGFLQLGGAVILARAAYRRAPLPARRRAEG
ncbi:hypothetical protein [Methylobacterium oxalidis]|uniref:Uncharacterized protein n=1 Tax=Methylobacterium oxalidis TaxID=944322 RepID=A0A512J572_9HYPH|nr:hypothetical protein [Methylobacterium oxalidis]GEP05083.1 hypothetical protein MOX02_31210 [Methylobacterium oxalidis]GJE34777.1 hypothetical protein LDDCCGHA_4992 [Methylobacterium oxalidis]GLS65638.1 hypothetical protein GCM10007888_40200 [Methylobacterium oxalidis]